jgi:hypothetical protein
MKEYAQAFQKVIEWAEVRKTERDEYVKIMPN